MKRKVSDLLKEKGNVVYSIRDTAKLKEIRDYCIEHKQLMWAAKIGGIIDGCDFIEFGSQG